jgi:septum formation topological specificity factor MinE
VLKIFAFLLKKNKTTFDQSTEQLVVVIADQLKQIARQH